MTRSKVDWVGATPKLELFWTGQDLPEVATESWAAKAHWCTCGAKAGPCSLNPIEELLWLKLLKKVHSGSHRKVRTDHRNFGSTQYPVMMLDYNVMADRCTQNNTHLFIYLSKNGLEFHLIQVWNCISLTCKASYCFPPRPPHPDNPSELNPEAKQLSTHTHTHTTYLILLYIHPSLVTSNLIYDSIVIKKSGGIHVVTYGDFSS